MKNEYLRLFHDIHCGAATLKHLLHSLPLSRHAHTPSTNACLYPYKCLHASQGHCSLLPHLSTSNQGLKPHQSFQCPQCSSCLNHERQSECEWQPTPASPPRNLCVALGPLSPRRH
ncbi:hypothetical protein DsansV1_C11g0111951 [Dioscorea sansibarensis]